MFCLTNVRVFSERHKHNLKDKDTNIFVHKISHFGIQKFSIKFIQREHEGEKKEKKYKREDTFTIAIPYDIAEKIIQTENCIFYE